MGNSVSASLLLAARSGNANGVKQLVQQGADINTTFEDEKTALHVASEEGKDDVVTLLISLGAKVTTLDKQKYTPLHSAVYMGHASTVGLLIEHGADINSKDIEDMTPLHWAVKMARFDCVELLITKGADTSLKNKKGETALDLANKLKPRKLRPDMVAHIERSIKGEPAPASTLNVVDTARINRLASLCSIWGTVKYAHPHLHYKLIDWDSALLETISQIGKASASGAYFEAIQHMLGKLGDANTRVVKKQSVKEDTLRTSSQNGTSSPTISFTEDHYALISMSDCYKFQDFSKAKQFVAVFTEARVKAKGVVFDCRCDEIAETNLNSVIFLKQMFYEAFRIFITDALPLPSSRTRIYRGHHLEWNRFESENYFEGSLSNDGEVLLPPAFPRPPPPAAESSAPASAPVPSTPPPARVPPPASPTPTAKVVPITPAIALTTPLPASPAPARPTPTPEPATPETPAPSAPSAPSTPSAAPSNVEPAPQMAFIVNKFTPACLIDLISALQCKGMALAILEDPEYSGQEEYQFLECGIPSMKIDVGDDVSVQIRTADRINPDGSLGFVPDLVVSKSEDLTEQATLHLRSGQFAKVEGQSVLATHRPPLASSYNSRVRENEYFVDSLTPETRLLALFKFWSVVEFFYPYKETSENWSHILQEFIPLLEDADTPLAYSLAIAELVSRLNDTHAYASSPILNDYMGTHVPLVSVQRVEGRTIFTFVDPKLEGNGPNRGDELISIDGVEEIQVREKLAKIIPASTPQAKSWRIDQLLLAGKPNSTVTVITKNMEGVESTFSLVRTTHPSLTPTAAVMPNTPSFGVIHVGIGYIDTVRLNSADIDKALEAVKDQACLIIDVRGFPHDSLQKLVARLARNKQQILRTHTPLRTASSLSNSNASMVTEVLTLSPHPHAINYQGKVVVLINEKTASLAEQQLLYLESVCANVCGGVAYVGSPTNGSVGKMTNVKLPGEIFVGLSGVGMKGIDGKIVQGTGLRPKIPVDPTIRGIIAQEDEVYERALDYCKSYLQSPTSPVAPRARPPRPIVDGNGLDESVPTGEETETEESWPEV